MNKCRWRHITSECDLFFTEAADLTSPATAQ